MNQSMQQLKKIGTIKPKNSKQIKFSRIGLGLEKLDREVFDPEKVYDKVADTGVKWARIQSGWQRTERQKGVYDFDWIDSIVDNLLQRGVEPWVCLCYGNGLYSDDAKKIFGAVGCPPIFNDEQKNAWANYVKHLPNILKTGSNSMKFGTSLTAILAGNTDPMPRNTVNS